MSLHTHTHCRQTKGKGHAHTIPNLHDHELAATARFLQPLILLVKSEVEFVCKVPASVMITLNMSSAYPIKGDMYEENERSIGAGNRFAEGHMGTKQQQKNRGGFYWYTEIWTQRNGSNQTQSGFIVCKWIKRRGGQSPSTSSATSLIF